MSNLMNKVKFFYVNLASTYMARAHASHLSMSLLSTRWTQPPTLCEI